MTSKAARRELTRDRVARHRARGKRGVKIYRIEAHEQRLAEVLLRWGMEEPFVWYRERVETTLGEVIELIIRNQPLAEHIGELIQRRL